MLMTFLVAMFAYWGRVTEGEVRALFEICDVYGIRALFVDEKNRNIRVEYDASLLASGYRIHASKRGHPFARMRNAGRIAVSTYAASHALLVGLL